MVVPGDYCVVPGTPAIPSHFWELCPEHKFSSLHSKCIFLKPQFKLHHFVNLFFLKKKVKLNSTKLSINYPNR